MNRDQLVVEKLNTAVPDAIEEVYDFRGDRTLYIEISKLKEVCIFLRDDEELQYNFLSDICADDMLPDYPRFAVNYQIHSMPHKHRLRLRVRVEDPENGPETMVSVLGDSHLAGNGKFGI